MADQITKVDPLLKTDKELLELVIHRMALPSAEIGVSDFGIVEGAIGALFIGQYYGLRILRIIHSTKTLRQYEKFYGASFEELVPQHGRFIDRSFAWRVLTTTREYWDVVARKVKMDGWRRRAIDASV